MSTSNSVTIPYDLFVAKGLIYDKYHCKGSFPIKEKESSEYGAYTFEINTLSVKFLTAKITPTMIGQFVTLRKEAEKARFNLLILQIQLILSL